MASKERYALTCELPDLDNGEYVKETDVPVFHDGGENKYSPDDLELIASNTNKREKTCDLPVLAIGHQLDDTPEHFQPPIVGFSRNFRVVDFADRPTIIADLYYRKDQADKRKDYPRRSAEIWRDDKYIDRIALLGNSTPGRDDKYIDRIALLGNSTPGRDLSLVFSKKGKKAYYCQEGENKGKPGPCPGPEQAKPTAKDRAKGIAKAGLKSVKKHTIGEAKHWLKAIAFGYKKHGLKGSANAVAKKSFKKGKQTFKKLQSRYGTTAAVGMMGLWLGINGAAIVNPKIWLLFPEPLGMIVGAAEGVRAAIKGASKAKALMGFEKHEDVTPEALADFLKGFNKDLGLPEPKPEQISKAVKDYFGKEQHCKEPMEEHCKEGGVSKPGPCKGQKRGQGRAAQPKGQAPKPASQPDPTKRLKPGSAAAKKRIAEARAENKAAGGGQRREVKGHLVPANTPGSKKIGGSRSGKRWSTQGFRPDEIRGRGNDELTPAKTQTRATGNGLQTRKGRVQEKRAPVRKSGEGLPIAGKAVSTRKPRKSRAKPQPKQRTPEQARSDQTAKDYIALAREKRWDNDKIAKGLTQAGLGFAHTTKQIHSKNASAKNTYSQEQSKESMDSQELVDALMKALEASGLPQVVQYVADQMESQGEESEDVAPEAQPEAFAEDADGDMGSEDEMLGDEELGDEKGDMPEEYQATRRKLHRYSKRISEQESRIAELERTARVAERKADLLSLEQEGYEFDFADELNTVSDMPKEMYSKHLSRVKRNYRKAPIGPIAFKPVQGPAKDNLTYEDSRKAADLVTTGKARDLTEAFNLIRGGN